MNRTNYKSQIDWVITVPLNGLSLDQFVGVAPFACKLESVTEVHSVISTGAALLTIRKITANSQAPGAAAGASVVELLNSSIDLNGVAANTLRGPTLSAVVGALNLALNDRVAFDFSAVITGYIGCVTLRFQRI